MGPGFFYFYIDKSRFDGYTFIISNILDVIKIMETEYRDCAKIFRALCDEKRLQILGILREGERCGSDLLARLDISQPTLSYHMKILCRSGIVAGREDGKRTYYRISEEGSATACRLLRALTILCPEEAEKPRPQEPGEHGKRETPRRYGKENSV